MRFHLSICSAQIVCIHLENRIVFPKKSTLANNSTKQELMINDPFNYSYKYHGIMENLNSRKKNKEVEKQMEIKNTQTCHFSIFSFLFFSVFLVDYLTLQVCARASVLDRDMHSSTQEHGNLLAILGTFNNIKIY